MFTGLIETTGRIVEVNPRRGSTRIAVASDLPHREMTRGESVSVDGACLTVTELLADRFRADVIAETLARTTLGKLRPGRRVNLERALRLDDRLGGHLVQGHVDGVAPVVELIKRADDRRVRVGLDGSLDRYIAYKGSVAIQGVSLTVSAVEPAWFEVALIPETLARTNFDGLKVGDRLNLEVDLLARYLERLVRK